MLVFKMLMSFLAVLAINARYSHSHTLTETKQDCSCFPIDKDNVRISTLADAYGNHIRKVIYLFSHPDSGKVTVYLPNEQKQNKFPDLTVSKLEQYGLTKVENLYQLFEDDQKLVTTLPLVNKPIPVDTSFLDIADTDNGVYQLHPHFNTVNTNTETKVNVDETPDPTLYDQIFTLDLQNQPPESVNQNIYPIIDVINEKLYTTNKEQAKDYVSLPLDVIEDNIDGTSDEQDTVDDTNSLHPWDIDGKDLVNDLDIIMKPVVKPVIPLNPATDKKNIFLVHDNIVPNYLDTNQNFNQHNEIPTNDIRKPIFDSLIQSNSLKPQTEEVPIIVDNSTPYGPVSNPELDEWLFEEIKNIGSPELETSPLHPLDLQKIKIHLLNVLRQSGLHPENGHLIDIYGYTSKFSNIKLRRVLISEPSVYMQILTGNKCPTSQNIPYLEAIFVSLAYPPKVLGLIPLRMTFLPSCHQYGCMGDTCAKKNYNKPVTMNAKLQTPSNYKGREKQGFPVGSSIKNFNLKLEPTYVDSGVSRGRVGQEEHNKIPINLDHLKLDPPPVMVGVNDGYVVYEDQGERTLDGDNDDGLGIRIIGGNAATSSGTPVNSRGRRAYNPFSIPMA